MVKIFKDKIQAIKTQSYIQLFIMLAIFIVINVISRYAYERFDLTDDKRYSLGEPTKEMLRNLDDIVHITIYLDGELPPGFRRLRQSTLELLDEFRTYAGDNIEYSFIDPNSYTDRKTRDDLYKQLMTLGLNPVNLEVRIEGGTKQSVIFPGAIISYKNKNIPVELIQSQMGMHPEMVLHNSILALEYEFANSIRKLQTLRPKRIAIIDGHGELAPQYTRDFVNAVSEYYEVERLELPAFKVGKLEQYDLAIIAKPTKRFSEVDKYKIDQFIMKGGKVIWLINSLLASMDSLDSDGIAFTSDFDLNLSDQLFNYGIRINYNLIQDLHAGSIPLLSDQAGGRPVRDLKPWFYYPLIVPISDHPIVNNLNTILFRFTNTIDTIATPGIDKKILLTSSPYSRILPHPVRINLQSVRQPPPERLFRSGQLPVTVLLEGKFTSLYKNRIAPATLESGEYGEFKEESEFTQMIVISDGDVIRNDVNPATGQIFPLGFNRYTNQTFGNLNFLLNCVDYLLDDSGLIILRAKDYRIRMLDKSKAENTKTHWQLMNIIVPLVFLLVFGLLYNYIRKRKYSS